MAVGDYQVHPLDGIPSLIIAHPVVGTTGELRAVAILWVQLDWLSGYAASIHSDPGHMVDILNQDGVIRVRYPDPALWIGRSVALPDVMKTSQSGTTAGAGVDGSELLYAFVSLENRPEGEQHFIRIGIPAADAYAEAKRGLLVNVSLLAVAGLVALLAAWRLSDPLVLQPLRAVFAATEGLGRGDFGVRVGAPYPAGEFGRLARAFDAMAAALQAHDKGRAQAESQVRTLNQTLEQRVVERTSEIEQANLDLRHEIAEREQVERSLQRQVAEHERAERSLQRHAAEQATLYGVSAELATALDPHGMFGAVLRIVLQALGAEKGWVLVGDGVIGPRRSVLVWSDLPDEFVAVEAQVPPEKCPVCVPMLAEGHLRSEPQVVRHCPWIPAPLVSAAGVACHISVPLVSDDRILGILNIGISESRTLSREEKALLSAIGRQMGVALDRAQLHAAATRHAGHLAVLNNVGQVLSASLDVDRVLETLLESVLAAVPVVAGRVALAAGAGAHQRALGTGARGPHTPSILTVRQVLGTMTGDLASRQPDISPDLLDRVFASQQPVVVSPAENAAAPDIILVPLVVGGRPIGVLELQADESRRLDDEELQLLQAIGAEAAAAIENALLYERAQEQFRKLEESQARLIHAEKSAALGQLAASLAHEINNPLQSLRGHLDLVIDFPLEPQERSRYLQVARQEILRLSEIARRVLNFWRPNPAGRNPTMVDELLERTVLLLATQMEKAGIEVRLNLGNCCPVIAVPDQLMQVFLNLMLNAAQAIGQDGCIEIATSSCPDYVEISVANDGPPIPEEHLPKLFDAFFTTRPGGTGLGLAVARNIISQHEGTIAVANRMDGNGVVFTIRLPVLSNGGSNDGSSE